MLAPRDVLAHRRWLRCSWPFPHVAAYDVFVPEFHDAISCELRTVLARGLSEHPDPDRLSRMNGYDAYGSALTESSPEPLALFISEGWRDLLADLFAVGRTPYVFAGIHHHLPGGRPGFIHNDCNPVWFPAATEGIRLPDETVCAYKSGEGSLAGVERAEVLRGVAMLYFLLNDDWRAEDGGETGLYASREARLAEPDLRFPPRSNTLIAFECTPASFHAYLASPRRSRTSIIMWIHRPLREGLAQFGADRIERWKR